MYIKSQTRADARGLVGAVLVGSITGLALGGVYLMGGLAQSASTHARVARLAEGASGEFSDAAMLSASTRMDPGALAVAKRHDPYLFAALDQRDRQSAMLTARLEGAGAANNLRPGQSGRTGPLMLRASFGSAFNVSAPALFQNGPFQLGNALESSRELECLADAVYYEARGETPSGQAAVAQVVMNRVRHPAFPKSICGVVFQGAYHRTGCQFSFACDGSMRRARDVGAWNRARKVASRTLAGDGSNVVGSATHFHTINVSPGWGPRLLRVAQVGMHIFYRFGRHGAPAGLVPSHLPTVDDIAPSEIASLTADGKPPVVYAASALGRLEPAQMGMGAGAGMGGPIGPVSEPASAPIATAPKAPAPTLTPVKSMSTDKPSLDGLKTTVGAGSGAAS
ncbi:cell wall hydrolase [Caulobacter segnis]|uniref:cell wall hydrolase n=1 Tax=Caulobacter segnis TaxID=88688 RepID=UPI001CC0A780|nr:cell wall hydrolase [Caulobacter segnis]UAL09729.1 cell wall hydrolase [Caulobacter segnis]